MLANLVGADCYDYSVAKLAEMEKKSESSSDADLCENKFVIDMSSIRFKKLFFYKFSAYLYLYIANYMPFRESLFKPD